MTVNGTARAFTVSETEGTNDLVSAIAPYVGGTVIALLMILALRAILPWLGRLVLPLIGWGAIRFSFRARPLWHRLIRPQAEKAWGTLLAVGLPNFRLVLEKIYIPLRVRLDGDLIGFRQAIVDGIPLIVVGGAGSGKTTMVKQLAIANYSETLGSEKKLLAVVIKLREMAVSGQSIEEAISKSVATVQQKSKAGRIISKLIETAIEDGDLLLVLDGLDEVPDESPANLGRTKIVNEIISFWRLHREKPLQLIITCRESSFRKGELDEVTTKIATIQPLTDEGIDTLLMKWPPYRNHSVRDLIEELRGSAIRDACRNPLLLTLLAAIFLQKVSSGEKFLLPQSRREFYEEAIKELLQRRPTERQQRQIVTASQKREILEIVAANQFEDKTTNDPESISASTLDKIIKSRFASIDAERLVGELVNENAILNPVYARASATAQESYIFAHRTFLEYFAAYSLLRRSTVDEVLQNYGDRNDCVELILFYCTVTEKISEVSIIVKFFADRGNPLMAADCLIAARPIEDQSLIRRVAEGLISAHALQSARANADRANNQRAW